MGEEMIRSYEWKDGRRLTVEYPGYFGGRLPMETVRSFERMERELFDVLAKKGIGAISAGYQCLNVTFSSPLEESVRREVKELVRRYLAQFWK